MGINGTGKPAEMPFSQFIDEIKRRENSPKF